MADDVRTAAVVEAPAPLTAEVASTLSSATKSRPFWPPRSPRWVLQCFGTCNARVPVRGGAYRVNRVIDERFARQVVSEHDAAAAVLPSTSLRATTQPEGSLVDTSTALYETTQEVTLEPIESIVRTTTRVQELFSDTHDQLRWQCEMTAEYMYEAQENLVYNHPAYGLRHNVDESMVIDNAGSPSPHVLDDLLGLAWKRPDCYCMHPTALAAFRKSATEQGLTLEAVEIFGCAFTAWRGVPIFPTDKLRLVNRAEPAARGGRRRAAGSEQAVSTDILLLRMGLDKQGVVLLYAADVETDPSLPHISVRFMGLTDNAVESYLLTLYTAVAVLSSGALARARVTL
jgi:hypothetical protein